MTLRQAYNFLAAIVLLALLVGSVVLLVNPDIGTPPPTPPSGYEYCTPNNHANLCPKGTP